MFFSNLIKSGWLHALFIAIISYPFGVLVQKFVASYTDSNLLVYTFFLVLTSSITLLLMAGPGELANKTIKRPETWIYGFMQIVTIFLGILVMKYITATEGVALGLMTGVFTLILSAVFLNQKIGKFEIIGALIIISGFIIVINHTGLPTELNIIVIFLIALRGFSQGCQKIIAEVHKTNRKAVSFKSQIRVTGFIMAVASFVFLSFLLLIAFIKLNHDISIFRSFPNFEDFLDLKLYLLSSISGLIIMSISKYCEFYAGKTIGARYLTSISSIHIVIVCLIELAVSKYNLLEAPDLSNYTLFAVGVILFGNIIIAVSGFMKDLSFIKRGAKQNTLANVDGNFIEDESEFNLVKFNLANLLNLYDFDSKKLALDADLDRVVLDNIVNYDYGEFRIENKVAKKINNFASQHVATKDKLTKAYNRYYLDHMAESLFKQNELFNLYYLDFNKFKPINDEYGHEVGDIVLAKTVAKLNNLENVNNLVFRVGGDEFVLLQVGNIEQTLEDIITKTIEIPVQYQEIPLEISTSIGRVNSGDYDNIEDMLKDADALMFEHKKSKGMSR